MANADNWSSASLKAVQDGGLIREDVMQQIWDISNIPLPLTDMIASDDCGNSYAEWTTDKLAAPDINNAVVDGSDATGNNAKGGARVGNQCQISVKNVIVTSRADSSEVVGRSNELAYQVMERQKELRRDREAIYLTQQASVADNGDDVAGKLGGLGAWLVTNVSRGATGSNGGFSNGVVAAPTPGTVRALSETMIRDMAQAVWEQGGNPTTLMSVPAVIRKLSEYMFTESARIATLSSDVGQQKSAKVAQGSVNVFVTDFGVTLEMVANRLQPVVSAVSGSENANVYIIDPQYIRESFKRGYQVEELAKSGLSSKRLMSVDGTLKVLNEAAHGVIADIDYTKAVVA